MANSGMSLFPVWMEYILKKRFNMETCAGCGKPITKEETKMYGDRCVGCWYEDAQERTLNEEIE